jgi:hypothetical protein
MPEQSTWRTQGAGEYCRRVIKWIEDSMYSDPWDSMNNWHCSMNFWHLTSLSSEQLGGPSILRRSEVIKLKFKRTLEHPEGYATLFLWANWARSLWRKYFRTPWGLCNAIFVSQLGQVSLQEKMPAEYFRYGKVLGRYLCIWRCQNREGVPKDLVNTVEEGYSGSWAIGTLRFRL